MANPYLHDLLALLRQLEESTPATRRDLYRQASDQLLEQLKSSDPPADKTDIEIETALLAYTIRQVETDIRKGVDVFAEGYNPEKLIEIEAKLSTIRIRKKRYLATAELNEERRQRVTTRASEYWHELGYIDRFANLTAQSATQRFFATIFALTEFNLASLRHDNRLYLLGEIMLPILYVGIIIVLYTFLSMRFVYNMDVLQFAFTGAVTWVMFRQTMWRVMTVLSRPVLLGFWQVGNLHRSLASGALSLFIHTVSSVILLLLGYAAGLFQMPHDPAALTVGWLAIWVLGHNFGVILAGLTTGIKNIAMIRVVTIRALMIVFGMYYVSEQFPADVKYYVLFSPFVHLMQFFRGAYFELYQSQEIDYAYFGWWFVLTSVLALYFCGRVSRHVEAY